MYEPPNRTEAWQPLDAGHIGQTVKILAQSVLSNWLELDSIHAPGEKDYVRFEQGKLSMKEKRILVTFCFAQAWEIFQGVRFQKCRQMAWVHSGVAVTCVSSKLDAVM